jgi:hypothetical protein
MPTSVDITTTPNPSIDVTPHPQPSIQVVVGGTTNIVNNGTTGSIAVPFTVPTALWLINHNLGYVPIVTATDLAGNQLSIEMELTTTQIVAKPNQPTTGYIYYR